jgi:hypothetical protein
LSSAHLFVIIVHAFIVGLHRCADGQFMKKQSQKHEPIITEASMHHAIICKDHHASAVRLPRKVSLLMRVPRPDFNDTGCVLSKRQDAAVRSSNQLVCRTQPTLGHFAWYAKTVCGSAQHKSPANNNSHRTISAPVPFVEVISALQHFHKQIIET